MANNRGDELLGVRIEDEACEIYRDGESEPLRLKKMDRTAVTAGTSEFLVEEKGLAQIEDGKAQNGDMVLSTRLWGSEYAVVVPAMRLYRFTPLNGEKNAWALGGSRKRSAVLQPPENHQLDCHGQPKEQDHWDFLRWLVDGTWYDAINWTHTELKPLGWRNWRYRGLLKPAIRLASRVRQAGWSAKGITRWDFMEGRARITRTGIGEAREGAAGETIED
ncbi:hypothetical protein BKA70DRAFT_1229253 [Coprinopsis sp. MPI-PUGE-AT-0042]|nr:hypothetical protein BKA70DRAFT_1229253 [Coprinopsis sp. MPI-PUGE-AT-0042]